MTDKHTPGPWHVSTRFDDSWSVLDPNGFDLEDAPMSILEGWPDLGYEHWGRAPGVTYIERPDAEREANARLIAAAPLMLEALREAQVTIDWFRRMALDDQNPREFDPAAWAEAKQSNRQARAAIAAATGEDA